MTLTSPPPDRTGAAAPGPIYVLIPLFNDWAVAAELLPRLDANLPAGSRILLIDDGSTDRCPEPFPCERLNRIGRVEVVALRRNLGHQRAIALGLSFLDAERPFEAVVVMDGDGEDDPDDALALLDRLKSGDGPKVVFAERTRRSEDFVFRLGYQAYRLVHRVMTGVPVKVGNFSTLNRAAVRRLVVSSVAWNHYAAAVFRSEVESC